MKIQKFRKFQEGGAMPADPSMQGGAQEGAPMEGEVQQAGGDEQAMMQQLAQLAQQLIQQIGPDGAAMLAQIIMEMLQGGGQGQAPVGEQPEGEPVFKKGGKICGRLKKGAKMKKCGK